MNQETRISNQAWEIVNGKSTESQQVFFDTIRFICKHYKLKAKRKSLRGILKA